MAKLKLGPILDDKPVKVAVELPASLHRDLIAYAEALSRETGQMIEPPKLIAPMLARFLASDRGFRLASRPAAAKGAVRRQSPSGEGEPDR